LLHNEVVRLVAHYKRKNSSKNKRNVGLNVGLTEAQMRNLISVLETRVGKQEADNATTVLNNVISSRNR
jgi:hypothetical protein